MKETTKETTTDKGVPDSMGMSNNESCEHFGGFLSMSFARLGQIKIELFEKPI